MVRTTLGVFAVSILVLGPAATQTHFSLTIENIMRGPNLVGTEPSQVRWSGDGSTIYFQWKRASDPIDAPLDTWAVNRDGSRLRKLTDDEARQTPPATAEFNVDRSLGVFAEDGDIFVIETATGKRRQITKTTDTESSPAFLPDGRRISFVRGGNLFVMSVDSGELEQITDIRAAGTAPAGTTGTTGGAGRGGASGSSGSVGEPKGTDAQERLKKEQRELFEVVKSREDFKEIADAKQKKLNPRKPYTLQARQTIGQMQLTPDGKYVLAVIAETAAGSKNSVVPNWITDSSFPEDLPGRTRVGDGITSRRLAIINAVTGEVKMLEHGQGTPDAQIQDASTCGGGAAPSVAWFSGDGSKAVLSARSQDNKSCWYFALDPATAKVRVLNAEFDPAWLGGPGDSQGWLGDNRTFYFTSEHDGFNHLYEVAYDGGEPKQMTSGKFEVDRVVLSRDKSTFYLTTSEGSPYERQLWRMPVGGGTRSRLTKLPGNHQTALSFDEKWLADVYSFTGRPPELYVEANEPMAAAAKLTESPSPEFATYAWVDPSIVEIPARDGAKVPGHLYRPVNFPKGGPAVIFVHGAGYVQNVHRWWPSLYYHEYLFHHFLMEHGYLVLDVDYRGSRGYGRDWRTAIYRQMGGTDLNDQIDAAKWLVSMQGVDAKRIGIYGGSYGGFITLMAMFTQPDVFAAGAALRPVSDWANYNQGYTGNILNQPQMDGEAYKQSSPIYFASGLKGRLLIAHGMVDTNVHFVDTARLVQKLIELGKDNWDVAIYPAEDHAFREPSSWTDEYKRIFRLFESTLKGPSGGR